MQPTGHQLHVDQPLTQISIAYSNPLYIADTICPVVTVKKQSDIVPKFNQSFWFRDEAKRRAPGTASRGGGWTNDVTDTYFCARWSYRYEIADDDRDNTDEPWNLEENGSRFVSDKLQMRREVGFSTDFFKTGVWGLDRVGGTDFTQWSDYGGSTPLVDVTVSMDNVEARIGREAGSLVIGKQVWVQLKWHPDLIDSIKYTQKGTISVDLAASLFELKHLLVGRSIYTTSPRGTAEANVTYTRIWGKHALLLYVPDAPALMTPAACYAIVWNRVPNAIQYVKRMRNEEREVDIIEGNSYFVQKATATKAGEFLQNAVA
jgi:hypothetical protein